MGMYETRSLGRPLLGVMHDVALLYLTVAHGAGRSLSAGERYAALAQLRQWWPEADPAVLSHVLREAALSRLEQADAERLSALVAALERALPASTCERIARDLAATSGAAGSRVSVARVVLADALAGRRVRA